MVEHAAVNRSVTGSSPVWGAKNPECERVGFLRTEKTVQMISAQFFFCLTPLQAGHFGAQTSLVRRT